MEFWRAGLVVDLLAITVLLALAAFARSRIRLLRRLVVPDSIIAGAAAMLLGPSGMGLIPLDIEQLELLVYHAFAVVFIAVGLQAPVRHRSGSARSFAVALPMVAVMQVALGFGLVALFSTLGTRLHPGFGFMPMLGFQQGPGQALTFGSAWEPLGFFDGGAIGLVFAALGFAYCIGFGIPLLAYGRRRGWTSPDAQRADGADQPERSEPPPRPVAPGTLEPLSAQIAAIGCVYAAVGALLWSLTALMPEGSKMASNLWAFHFIAGSLIAIGVRRGAGRLHITLPLDDRMLARISVLAVDITTAAALAAVRLTVLERWLAPILVMTAATGALSLVTCMWLSRRAFVDAPFEHTIVLFGAATGTLATGLALLRSLDPHLRGPVARNVVVGATGAIPLSAPLMLAVLPLAVGLWESGWAVSVAVPAMLMALYFIALLFAWRMLTPARLLRPLRSVWPNDTPRGGP